MNNLINTYSIIFLVIVLAFSVTSCEKEIDVYLRSVPPRIQIEGIVKQDQLARVRVSQTLDFNNNSGYPFLKGAIVKISDNNGLSEILKQDDSGWYVAETLKGEIGHTYNMSVVYEGKEYTSTSTMPPLVKLDSLSMYKIKVMDYAVPMIHFNDPKGKENQYYRCLVYINGKQLPDMTELALSAEFMDGSPIHQFLPVFTNDRDVDPIKQGDDILIEFQSLDRGAYLFFKTLMDIENSLANPTTNIKGGALGYFSACTVDEMSIIAEWEE
ncbi:DUF4249 domain-containing protein [Dysgonomonas sp. Marseille-P4677]|uniref:DUF4249 domain-containing protein n=1 Tax=Dysgonomonas sp. Marseille-P4677 TaxID=2364790 RepID=UPI0019112A71|nr:DUF4249 domain-containing protein [Dysgonomonas sp. Marseille-P4677]MBK5719695.1 DUF4249 domain-containing protein [Dysgonomonas sp. Marseille-P4677]